MSKSKEKPNLVRQEEEVSNWSDLCPDLLRDVFNRLSFTELSRAKSVCSSWHSSSRGCVPTPNQIPWLILLPSYNFNNNCVLFVPDDKEKVYKTRDLGVDFIMSRCLATYGSWLLMKGRVGVSYNLYILNPLTGERIDLPDTKREVSQLGQASFWIDNKTKDYLIVLMTTGSSVFTKKADNKWHEFSRSERLSKIVYNHKNQKLYVYYHDNYPVKIWDFSGDEPRKNGFLDCFRPNPYNVLCWKNLVEIKRCLAVTISGDVLMVSCCIVQDYQDYKTWRFRVYKANHVNCKWVEIDSLGDEALILDMGVTVMAKEGMKRNSIYFSGMDYERNNLDKLFVFDLRASPMRDSLGESLINKKLQNNKKEERRREMVSQMRDFERLMRDS